MTGISFGSTARALLTGKLPSGTLFGGAVGGKAMGIGELVDMGVRFVQGQARQPKLKAVVRMQQLAAKHPVFASTMLRLMGEPELAQAARGAKLLAGETVPMAARDAAHGAARTKIAIVYDAFHDRHNYRPLIRELKALGAETQILKAKHFSQAADGAVLYKGRELKDMPEAVISRVIDPANLRGVELLEQAGAYVVNRPGVVKAIGSKVQQRAIFLANDIPHPTTIVAKNTDELIKAADELRYPVIIKIPVSSGGAGVMKVENEQGLRAVASQHLVEGGPNTELVAQQYMELGGRDHRVLVVRDADGVQRVTAVIERIGAKGDFRANGPMGNTVNRVPVSEFDPKAVDIAQRAADATGLDVAGVDLAHTSDGKWMVIEVNRTPGVGELTVPLARDEHMLPVIARNAVYGTR